MNDALLLTLVGVLVLVSLTIVVIVSSRKDAPAGRDTQDDLANMMILFQTMRDIIQQQKELARQFNESLDKKVGAIRQAASVAMENLDRLRELERTVRAQLEEARAELESVQKQTRYMREAPAGERRSMEEPESTPLERVVKAESIEPLIEVIARPAEVDADEPDLIDSWVGFDFHDEALPPVDEPEPTDHVPILDVTVGDDGRDAFRALLDFDRVDAGKSRNGGDGANGNGNGHGALSPTLQARVFQYYDAGMNVTQIAQELGIGKGEVRLMLNLRPGKDR